MVWTIDYCLGLGWYCCVCWICGFVLNCCVLLGCFSCWIASYFVSLCFGLVGVPFTSSLFCRSFKRLFVLFGVISLILFGCLLSLVVLRVDFWVTLIGCCCCLIFLSLFCGCFGGLDSWWFVWYFVGFVFTAPEFGFLCYIDRSVVVYSLVEPLPY